MGKQFFSQVQQINYAMYFTLGLAMCSLYIQYVPENDAQQGIDETERQYSHPTAAVADTSLYKHFLQ